MEQFEFTITQWKDIILYWQSDSDLYGWMKTLEPRKGVLRQFLKETLEIVHSEEEVKHTSVWETNIYHIKNTDLYFEVRQEFECWGNGESDDAEIQQVEPYVVSVTKYRSVK